MVDEIKEHCDFIGQLIDIGKKQLSAPLDVPRKCTLVDRTILDVKRLYIENFWNLASFLV
jgi:hypothetical protein